MKPKSDKGQVVPKVVDPTEGFEVVACKQTVAAPKAKGPSFHINLGLLSLNPAAFALLNSGSVDVLYNKSTKQLLLKSGGDIPIRTRMLTIGKGKNKGSKTAVGYYVSVRDLLIGFDYGSKYKARGPVFSHASGAVMTIGA